MVLAHELQRCRAAGAGKRRSSARSPKPGGRRRAPLLRLLPKRGKGNWPSFLYPKGIMSFSPAVARHELPWVCGHKRFQPQRGCVRPATDDATPLGLMPISSRFPRVASPTRQPLGFATESRWDSDRAKRLEVRRSACAAPRRLALCQARVISNALENGTPADAVQNLADNDAPSSVGAASL